MDFSKAKFDTKKAKMFPRSSKKGVKTSDIVKSLEKGLEKGLASKSAKPKPKATKAPAKVYPRGMSPGGAGQPFISPNMNSKDITKEYTKGKK